MMSNLTGWHALILVGVLLLTVLPFILAIVSIARTRLSSGAETAVWVLIVVVAPLLGAILWFAIGRRGAIDRRTT